MTGYLWVPLVVAASAMQTGRNAFQRSLLESAGPWGATLVRFLWGLPFAVIWASGAALLAPGAVALGAPVFWLACAVTAAAQILATAALLVSMQRSSFAVGSALQHFRLPLAAVVGLFLGDALSVAAWAGVAMATAGLLILSRPRRSAPDAARDWMAAGLGFSAGALFALSGNAIRVAGRTVAPDQVWLGAAITLLAVQALQTAALVAYLARTDRRALATAVQPSRASLGAGALGCFASACWFTAFGMAPAAAVQAVGVVEIPIAAAAGRSFFRERITVAQALGGVLAATGVVLAALG